MASELRHIQCANRTYRTLECLLQDLAAHSPWVAVTAFYKALHVIEAVFANEKQIQHTSDHATRERTLKTTRKFEQIYKHYSPLYRASLNARYLSHHECFDEYLSPEQVIDRLLRHHLCRIEASAEKFLSKQGSAQLVRVNL